MPYFKYVGYSNSEGVLCASLQFHDVEETAHSLELEVGGAVNEDPHLYGHVV